MLVFLMRKGVCIIKRMVVLRMGYKDRTWCCNKDCDNSCGRKFTEEDRKAAIRWWGGEGFPLQVSDFHKKEERE